VHILRANVIQNASTTTAGDVQEHTSGAISPYLTTNVQAYAGKEKPGLRFSQ
jgi:hypothetical protein